MKRQETGWGNVTLTAAAIFTALLLASCGGSGPGAGQGLGGDPSSTVRSAPIPAGAICPTGGVQVDSGIDENGNGLLDDSEVDDTVYVCNGKPGLVTAVPEPANSINCSNGGTRIATGIDENGNGKLDPEEETDVSYVCNADIIPPVVPTLDPYDSPTNVTPFVLSGSKEAASSIWINGVERVPLDALTTWAVKLDLTKEGKYAFAVTSVDEPGNVSGGVLAVVIYDITPPAQPTVSRVPSVVTDPKLDISGTKDGATSIEATVNGVTREVVPLTKDSTWAGAIELAEGDNKVEIAAVDQAGNVSKPFTFPVLLDSTAPSEVKLKTPVSPTTLSSQVLSGAKEANASVWINGVEAWPLDANTAWEAKVPLVEGTNTFLVQTQDKLGNTSKGVKATIVRDTQVGDVTVLSAKGYKGAGAPADPNSITLTWTDPTDTDLHAIVVRRCDTPCELSERAGVPVDEVKPGVQTAKDDGDFGNGLKTDVVYYYNVFVYDQLGNLSVGVSISATISTASTALDPHFGKSGVALHLGAFSYGAVGNAIAYNPDLGTIQVAGNSFNKADDDIAQWLVTDAGDVKLVFTDNASSCGAPCDAIEGLPDAANAIANWGRMTVIVGSTFNGKYQDMVVWRLSADGVRDDTFGTKGFFVFRPADYKLKDLDDVAYGVTVDSKGRILVTGSMDNGMNLDMVVWALDRSGNLDTTFGGDVNGDRVPDGFVIIGNVDDGQDDVGKAITTDASGRIVVTGYTGSPSAMTVWRFTPIGDADTTFGKAGVITDTDAAGGSGGDRGLAVVVDSTDPKATLIYVAGSSNNGTNADAVVWRLDEVGKRDVNFNSVGFTVLPLSTTDVGDDWASGIALDQEKTPHVVVSGTTTFSSTDPKQAAMVWRLVASDGSPDSSFGTSGYLLVDDTAEPQYGNGIALDKAGRILLVGYRDASSGATGAIKKYMAVWRVLP